MGLNALDVAVIAVYLACVTLLGCASARSRPRYAATFWRRRRFRGGRLPSRSSRPRPARSPSSACPGIAYEHDFAFLQLVIGYLAGRAIISVLLIPHYFRGELVTAYQLIERRFGQRLRTLTAGLFLITRAAAEGVRVFAVASWSA